MLLGLEIKRNRKIDFANTVALSQRNMSLVRKFRDRFES